MLLDKECVNKSVLEEIFVGYIVDAGRKEMTSNRENVLGFFF